MTTKTPTLTPTQDAILTHAVEQNDGKVGWFPPHIQGSARQKVLGSLLSRRLIAWEGDELVVTLEGYEAVDLSPPGVQETSHDADMEALVTAVESIWTPAPGQPARAPADTDTAIAQEPQAQAADGAPDEAPAPADAQAPACEPPDAQQTPQEPALPQAKGTTRTRDNTKQALVIQMLKRPEGATVAQIMAATGWLNHTVRGTLSGVLGKRLGLNLVSDKGDDGVRVYRIA